MSFASFVECCTEDMKVRIKENTWGTKEHIIKTKLLPYFGKLKMCNITAQQIITWQNTLMEDTGKSGKGYSPVYLKTINNHDVLYKGEFKTTPEHIMTAIHLW